MGFLGALARATALYVLLCLAARRAYKAPAVEGSRDSGRGGEEEEEAEERRERVRACSGRETSLRNDPTTDLVQVWRCPAATLREPLVLGPLSVLILTFGSKQTENSRA